MSESADRIAVEIAADAQSLLSALSASISKFDLFGAAAITAGVAAASAFAANAIGQASAFAESMQTVATKATLTAEQMAVLDAGIDSIRETTEGARFSQAQLAEALSKTAQAGKSPADMLMILSEAARVAALTKKPLGDVVEQIDNVLDATGRGADGAAHLADVLIVASTKMGGEADANVGLLAETLKTTAASADAFGVSLEAQAAIVQTMKERGRDANEVFAAMRALLAPNAADGEGFKTLGAALDDANITARPLTEILANVNEKVAAGALTSEAASALIVGAFGRNGVAVDALRKQLDDVQGRTLAFSDASADAARIVGQMATTPKTKLQGLKADLADVSLEVGEKLLPHAIALVGVFDRLVAVIDDNLAVIGPLVVGVSAGALAYGAITAGAAAWTVVQALLTAETWAMAAAAVGLTAGMLPLIATVAAIGIVVALLVVAWTRDWGGIQAKTHEVFASLKQAFDAIVTALAPVFQVIKDIVALWSEYLAILWGAVTRYFSLVWEVIGGYLKLIVDGVILWLSILFETWKAVWNSIFAFIAAIFLTLKALFTGDTDAIKDIWGAFGERLAGIWGEWATNIKEKVVGFIGDVKAYFTELPGKIVEGIGDLGSYLWGAFAGWLHHVADKLSQWASGALGLSPTLTEIAASIPGALVAGLANLGAGLWNGMVDGLRFVEGKVSEWTAGIVNTARNAWQSAQDIIKNGWSAASTAVVNVAQTVAEVAIPRAPAAATSSPTTQVNVTVSAKDGLDDMLAIKYDARLGRYATSQGWM